MNTYPSFIGEEASVAQDLRGNSPTPVRRLIALTRDDTLSRALQELGSGGLDVCIVSDAGALSEELLDNIASTALVDSESSPEPLGDFVDALATQFPTLRVLVAGHSTEQNLLATRIASGRVYRFVHKPASAQRLKLMVDAASRPADPRITVTQTIEALPDVEAAARSRPQPPGTGSSMPKLPLLIAGTVLILAAGAWWMFSGSDDTAPVATQPAAASPENSPAADLMHKADQAFAAARYAATDGSSAAELYRDAMKLDPKLARARSGFDRSIEYGLRGAEQSMVSERLDEAEGMAGTLQLLVPGNSRLAFLQSQIGKERARLNADASQRNAFEARQQQIQGSLAKMEDRLKRGDLLEPARDNALVQFRAAENIAPGDAAVRNARDKLLAALFNAADAELLASRATTARSYVDAAATINSGAPGLDPLRRRLEQLTARPTPAPAPAPQAAAVTPTSAPVVAQAPPAAVIASPAPASAPPAIAMVAASSLKKTNSVEPDYPRAALQRLVSGWVEVEFVVNAQGRVDDVTILNSEPREIFDDAAVAAVKRWRYAPVMRNGQAVTVRTQQRIRFTARER